MTNNYSIYSVAGDIFVHPNLHSYGLPRLANFSASVESARGIADLPTHNYHFALDFPIGAENSAMPKNLYSIVRLELLDGFGFKDRDPDIARILFKRMVVTALGMLVANPRQIRDLKTLNGVPLDIRGLPAHTVYGLNLPASSVFYALDELNRAYRGPVDHLKVLKQRLDKLSQFNQARVRDPQLLMPTELEADYERLAIDSVGSATFELCGMVNPLHPYLP